MSEHAHGYFTVGTALCVIGAIIGTLLLLGVVPPTNVFVGGAVVALALGFLIP